MIFFYFSNRFNNPVLQFSFKKSSTYCAIAKCLEDLERPFEEIKETYMKALRCSEESGHKSAVVTSLIAFLIIF